MYVSACRIPVQCFRSSVCVHHAHEESYGKALEFGTLVLSLTDDV